MVTSDMAARRQCFAQATLEARKHAFSLPSLAEKVAGKSVMHQLAVRTRRRRITASVIDGDGGCGDPEVLSTERMECLAVVSRVSQNAPDGKMAGGLADCRLETRRVVRRTQRQVHSGDQMGCIVAGGGELGIRAVLLHPPLSLQEITADMMALQTRGVDADVGCAEGQAVSIRAIENSDEQMVEPPPFSICASVFCSVV